MELHELKNAMKEDINRYNFKSAIEKGNSVLIPKDISLPYDMDIAELHNLMRVNAGI